MKKISLHFNKAKKYIYPANIPPMPWKDNIKPLPPTGLTSLRLTNSCLELYWTNSARATDGDTAKYFNIYASKKYPVDVSDPKNILVFRIPATGYSIVLNVSTMLDDKYYAVMTTIDKGNNESDPSNTIIFTIESDKIPVAIAKGQRE